MREMTMVSMGEELPEVVDGIQRTFAQNQA